MRHPTDGVLRRLVDEPAGVSEPDRRHVAGCPQCLRSLATAQQDAEAVAGALTTTPLAQDDVAAGWQRLSAAASAPASTASTVAPRTATPSVPRPRGGRLREALRRPAVAALAVAVVVGGGATAAANDWFQVFQTEKVAPVTFSAADLSAVPDLSDYGDVELVSGGDVTGVEDAAAAQEATGLDVPQVASLPKGVTGEPVYQVGQQVTATFTVDTDRAADAARRAGQDAPSAPAGLDGTQVRMTAGPGVAAMWSQSAGVPSLVVARAVAPTASTSGADFDAVRDYLLSVPGIPDDVASQLRAFSADGSTLPLPVPGDFVTTSEADVDGVPATVLSTRDRTLAAVVWVSDGNVTVVAGPLDTDEVLAVARGLR